MLLKCGAAERLLRVPWTARRSNQSILKEINPEYSLDGLILKLKFQYFGHLMQRAYSLEKTDADYPSPNICIHLSIYSFTQQIIFECLLCAM